MQISMPPARPPTETRDPGPETPAVRPAHRLPGPSPAPDFVLPGPHTPPPLSRRGTEGRHAGPAPASQLGTRAAPPARPGSGAGPWRPGPARKRGGDGGAGGLGVRVPEGLTCQDGLPRVRQLGLSGCGRSGRQIAGRGHGGEAGSGRRGTRHLPRVRASCARRCPRRRWRRPVMSGGGAVASAPGLRPAWSE